MPKDGKIYGKYAVYRKDGRDNPLNGDKKDAKYFVLDYVHDDYAREAMMFYAFKCAEQYPQLAADIWAQLNVNFTELNNISGEVKVVTT